MTDLGFPNNPALNELFTSGWSTWMFDGVKWQASVPSGGVYEPVFGGRQFPMYGFLYQETAGDPGYSDWAGFGAHRWRFGVSPGDDFAAGSIDYRGYVSDALSIVGAGATAGTRKINLYDNVNVSGNLTVGTTTILGGGGGIVSVGNITATGPLTISGPMGTTGSNAIFTFQDRTGTTNWGWYAQAGVARLWNDQSGDRITIDGGGTISTPGSVRAAGNLYLGGAYVLFSGVTAGGPFIFGGTTDIATQLGTGNGAFKWYSNPGAELMRLDSTGTLVNHSEIHSQGPVASLWFQDRGGAFDWAWYADSGNAHLYNTYGGVGRIVVNVDVNGQASFAQGVYGAAFAINGTGHYIYDALSGHLGLRAGGAAGPYGYASLGADSSWTCGDIHAGNIYAPNFLINDGSAATAGTLGFLSGNGPGIQIWGNTSPGAGSIIFSGSTGTTLFKSDSAGNLTSAGTINVGSGVIELGQDRGGDGYAYVDFHAQAGTDFDFRIIRNPGANGGASIVQNGTAPITFAAPNFSFNTAAGTGNALLEIYGTSGWDSLRVRAPNGNFIVLKPETGAGWCQIGYYVAGGWGTIEIPGNLQVDSVFYAAGISSGNNINMGGNYLTFQNSPANLAASGPMLYGDNNWIVAKPGSGNLGFMLYDNAGQMRATIGTGGNILLTGNGNSGQVRMANSNTGAGYGSFWRNDSSNTYLLLTAVNDAFGVWNTLRPFTVDNVSGNVTLGHLVTCQSWVNFNTGATFNGSSASNVIQCQNGSNYLQLFDDGNGHIECNTNLWLNGNTGLGVICGGALTVYGGFGTNGNITCQGSIYTNHVVMNNACLLYGRDTAGTQQWLITMWGDNVIYVGDGSHDLHLRGYTTYCDNSNEFRCNNAIHAVGSNAMLYFDDRTDGVVWGWYAHNSVVHLYSNLDGDRVAIDRGGNISTGGIFTAWDVHANSGLFCNGLLFQNYTGWWWTGSPIHTDSEMACSAITAGGHRIYDSGGWEYHDAGIHANQLYSRNDSWCANNMTAGGSMQANGTGWSLYAPNGGIYSPNEIHGGLVTSGGDIRLGGSVTCSGWYYGGGNGGAQIRCWAGDWGAMSYAMSGGYFEVSPDQGASGYVLQPVTAWSDARLKTGIRDSEVDALAVLGAIPIRAFEWTERGQRFMPGAGPVSCGLVAQEIKELIPNAVAAVGLLGGGMLRIVSDHLDAYYIRAFQQLAARVEELEDLVRNERSLT
jgi:hypothetical protein